MGVHHTGLYDVLGVTPDITDEGLKKAYRRLATQAHPDRNQEDPAAHERFSRISTAYNWLCDPQRRALYDEFGEDCMVYGFDPELAREQLRAREQQNAHDIFSGLYGAAAGTRPHHSQTMGRDRGGNGGGHGMKIDDLAGLFASAAAGATAGTTAWRPSAEDEDWTPPRKLYEDDELGGDVQTEVWIDFRSAMRGGSGSVRLPDSVGYGLAGRDIPISIPPGVEHGEKVRVTGMGATARDGRRGDLVVTVFVSRDDTLSRQGRDLYQRVRVSEDAARDGCVITVPTLDSEVKVRIPPGARPGSKLRLRGRGVPDRAGVGAGDLFVVVIIDLPPPPGVRRRTEWRFDTKLK